MSNTIKVGLIGLGEGSMYASDFSDAMDSADPEKPLIIDFHSEGGSVFEGFEIANLIRDYAGPTVARVRSAAFSIASYCAIACDEIEIAANGFFMIHNPYSKTEGDDQEHAKSAKLLGELKSSMVAAYANKTGQSEDEVTAMMKAETYIGADEAIQIGLADRVINAPQSTKPLSKKHLPVAVLSAMYGSNSGKPPAATPKETEVTTAKKVAASVKTIKAAFPKAKNEFIVKCMEEELTEEEVTSAHARAMEEENEELIAKVSAMEEELAALKAKAMDDETAMEEEEAAKAKAEEEESIALAKRGLKPVATRIKGVNTAPVSEQWDDLVGTFVAKGQSRIKAVVSANKARPDLRKALVQESN